MSKHFSSGPWYIESGESSRVYLVNAVLVSSAPILLA